MAANKFATMLHRKTNKITLILVYALLEWILIVLLLLNALFSYLIIKFAEYFGLKRPCLWCSRLDHLFEPAKSESSYRDLVCDAHASEISKLGYCSNHQKLTELQDMCEDCSSSSRSGSQELPKSLALFPWMKQISLIQENGDKPMENCEMDSKCSCCGAILERKFQYPYILIKPSWELLDYTQKENLIEAAELDGSTHEGDHSDHSRSDIAADHQENEEETEENRGIQTVCDGDEGVESKELETEEEFSCFISSFDCKQEAAGEGAVVDLVVEEDQELKKVDVLNASMDSSSCEQTVQVDYQKDASPEIVPKHLDFYIDREDCHLIPVELMDSPVVEKQSQFKFREEEHSISGSGDVILDFELPGSAPIELVVEKRCSSGEKEALCLAEEREEDGEVPAFETLHVSEIEESIFVLFTEQAESTVEEPEKVPTTQPSQTTDEYTHEVQQESAASVEETTSNANQVLDEQNDENEAEISIGTEIPDHETIDDMQTLELLPSYECTQEDPSTSSAQLYAETDHGLKDSEEEFIQFKPIMIEKKDEEMIGHLEFSSELHEVEEDKFPDTPTSIDSLHQLHKKLLLLDRKESGTEESLDGSVMSDIESGDGVLTVEKLKSALKAERTALKALYAELEEERSASAVAANQTMAMINRLQEEKAAMQMEALQYQRMMEEQSEYDQEALQLLNELMVKREKEKAELEKELEIYRKKVQEYEAKEKMMLMRRRKEGSSKSANSSAYCSNAEDSDGLSLDLNHEPKEDDAFDNVLECHNQNTPADAVLYLESSLSMFEEERISILDQLKALEEKLFSLNDEEQHYEDVRSEEYLCEENGNGYHENSDFSSEMNGVDNGHFKQMNGKHHPEKKTVGPQAKRLLPLFDAAEAEIEDGMLNGHENGCDSVASRHSSAANFEMETKKHAIEEEVDHVYDRLQALEADREFLRHCINSLRKGDKGIYLLQEILQHLRDLRSVELQAKTMGDGTI